MPRREIYAAIDGERRRWGDRQENGTMSERSKNVNDFLSTWMIIFRRQRL